MDGVIRLGALVCSGQIVGDFKKFLFAIEFGFGIGRIGLIELRAE